MLKRNTKPLFGIITPTEYLEQYASQSHFHLVLAHLVDTDETYASFYKRMSERGDFIICDNGAFELGESYDPTRLVELAMRCGANAIVLPDYPAQPAKRTIEAAIEYASKVKEAGYHTFFAPQSEIGDLDGWIGAYEWGANNDLIDIMGMSILAIPNALPHIPRAYARVVMTQMLIDRGAFRFNKYHHYLGLNSAPNVELPPLIKMGAMDSCDSSNPVWAGVNGIKYDTTCTDYMNPCKSYLRHVDFNEPMAKPHIQDIVQYNIDITLEIVNNPDSVYR